MLLRHFREDKTNLVLECVITVAKIRMDLNI